MIFLESEMSVLPHRNSDNFTLSKQWKFHCIEIVKLHLEKVKILPYPAL